MPREGDSARRSPRPAPPTSLPGAGAGAGAKTWPKPHSILRVAVSSGSMTSEGKGLVVHWLWLQALEPWRSGLSCVAGRWRG